MATLKIRPATEADLEFTMKAEEHADNRAFVSQGSLEAHQTAVSNPDYCYLIFETPENNNRVGYAISRGLQNPYYNIELMRIIITEKGQGYGHEALRIIKRKAFEEWQAHRLWLDVVTHNQRARHVYASEGFVLEGILRDCIKTETGDEYESLAIMSILENEYRG